MSEDMRCAEARTELGEYHHGRLPLEVERDVRAHLEGCVECAKVDSVERALTSALEQRLPRYAASPALKQRLAARWAPAAPRRRWTSRWRPVLVPALAVAATVLVATPALYYDRQASRAAGARRLMLDEVVNDHLRVVTSEHPLDIESGGIHQVKPWFDGRLDFAPVVPFEGDADFVLKGGAVGYFRDRKAAVLVYRRRLHPITLLVFRADGLDWPPRGLPSTDVGSARATVERGFNLVLWRRGDLGYALVSDVDARELKTLAGRLMQ